MLHYDPRSTPKWTLKAKQEREWPRQKKKKKTPQKTWKKCRRAAAEVRDRHGEMCGLSAGYCVGSVISGREWCIIIQNVMPAERS